MVASIHAFRSAALFLLQVVQEVLLWSRAPMEVRRLCARKEELFRELQGDAAPAMPPGTNSLLQLLAKHDVSCFASLYGIEWQSEQWTSLHTSSCPLDAECTAQLQCIRSRSSQSEEPNSDTL